MILAALIFSFALISGSFGAVAGVVFFLILAAVAFVMYKALRRTVKMAVRMMIVAVILLVAVVGGISFWMFAASKDEAKPAKRPPNSRNR